MLRITDAQSDTGISACEARRAATHFHASDELWFIEFSELKAIYFEFQLDSKTIRSD